jgi:hypothetical protein
MSSTSRKRAPAPLLNRRQLCKAGAGFAAVGLSPFEAMALAAGNAAQVRSDVRVLDIMIPGGAALLDFFPHTLFPELAASPHIDAYYKGLGSVAVPGKPLAVTNNFQAALGALQGSAASLVVGVDSGTPAHEFGIPFASTGHHEFVNIDSPTATITTVLGALSHNPMPAHMIINSRARLGKFAATPFLAGSSLRSFTLAYGSDPASASFKGMIAAGNLATALDNGFFARLPRAKRDFLRPWYEAMVATRLDLADNVYANLIPTAAEISRYQDFLAADDGAIGGIFPATIRAFQHDFTKFIALGMPGYWDTHGAHATTAPANVAKVGKILSALCADLASTPDPSAPGKTLADTTIIRMTTEFTRTPNMNSGGGFDHHTWSWALILGPAAYVKDGLILGGVDAEYKAQGWENGQVQPLTTASRIDHGHVVCAMYKFMGVDLSLVPELPTTMRQQFAAGAGKIGVFKNA